MSTELTWFTSSYCASEGSQCVEVAHCTGTVHEGTVRTGTVHVRDGKVGDGPVLDLAPAAWAAFTEWTG